MPKPNRREQARAAQQEVALQDLKTADKLAARAGSSAGHLELQEARAAAALVAARAGASTAAIAAALRVREQDATELVRQARRLERDQGAFVVASR